MGFIRFLLIFFLNLYFLHATIYEDAEDRKTSRWNSMHTGTIYTDSLSSINNIYDSSKKSRVIEFKSDGNKHTYELKTTGLQDRQTKENGYWLSWQMQFSEDFVIIVLVQSNRGKHYLVYTPGIFKGHMQYGLGHASTNGKWQTFERNIQEDIAYFDNRVKVVSLKSFVVKGNGRVDNIETKTSMFTEKKKLLKKVVKQYKQTNVVNKPTRSLPVISIRGAKLVKLGLGETYVESGVSAYDKEDGDINVESMEQININEVGEYMVLYMATDSHGNMAIDKRYVHVGEFKINKRKIKIKKEEEVYEEEEIELSREEEQIAIWEKELLLRERELIQIEKKSNKNWKRN